jgi:hypothetical protein
MKTSVIGRAKEDVREEALSMPEFQLLQHHLEQQPKDTILKTADLRKMFNIPSTHMGWMLTQLKYLGIVGHVRQGYWIVLV